MALLHSEAVVIGAGVVGLAIARELSRRGVETLVLEQCTDIGQGTSSRNSEVIHAGIYYGAGTLKERLCLEGKQRLYDYCREKGIPYERCGKLVVATNESQISSLRRLEANAVRARVEIQRLTAKDADILEPEVRCIEALLSPTTGIVDSHALMEALRRDAETDGATIAFHSRVQRIRNMQVDVDDEIRVVADRFLVNSAGLEAGSLVDEKIKFAKGSYFSCRKRPFQRLVYPLPDNGGLGIHATVDLSGAVRFGPDVEVLDITDPKEIDYSVDERRVPIFYDAIRRYWPGISSGDLIPDYAGVRPKVKGNDFVIVQQQGFVSLLGIESPGLTASLALADYVANLLKKSA